MLTYLYIYIYIYIYIYRISKQKNKRFLKKLRIFELISISIHSLFKIKTATKYLTINQ